MDLYNFSKTKKETKTSGADSRRISRNQKKYKNKYLKLFNSFIEILTLDPKHCGFNLSTDTTMSKHWVVKRRLFITVF